MNDELMRAGLGARLLLAFAPVAAWFALLVAGCAGVQSSPQPSAASPETAAGEGDGRTSRTPLDLSSADAFTKSIAARVSETFESAEVRVTDPLTLEVRIGGNDLRVALDRIWRFCGQAPEECGSEVDALVAALHESEQPDVVTPDNLVAAIRTVSYLQAAREAHGELLVEPFVGELVVVCMLDQQTRARLVSDEDLPALGLDRAGAFRRAKENARRRLGGIEKLLAAAQAGRVGVVHRGEYYESSQLLDTAGWTELSRTRSGSLVAAVPAVDVLMFTWMEDSAGVEPFRALAKELANQSARPLSRELLRFSEGKWNSL